MKTCKTCNFCRCIGTRCTDNANIYECFHTHRFLGENINGSCDKWEEKDNVIRLCFGNLEERRDGKQ